MARAETMWLQQTISIRQLCVGLLLAMLALAGCNTKPDRIRVDRARLVGVYEAPFRDEQRERLELRSDGTYVQDFVSKTRPFQHTGQWHIEDHFWDGTDVVLTNATVNEEEDKQPLRAGD